MFSKRQASGMIACLVTLFALSGLALPALAQEEGGVEPAPATGERVRGYVPPPTELRFVDDHWTPYDPPRPPEGVDVHVIVKGDTLWDLAQTYYGEPYLWPVIWDANRYITYSHWIYPGDPLVVPPKPTLVTDEGVVPPEPEPEPEPEPVRIAERPPAAAPFQKEEREEVEEVFEPALVPAAEEQELLCTQQLYERFDPTPLTIAGAEEPDKTIYATDDIFYLSAGQDLGIQPGSEYVVVRAESVIEHPESGEPAAIYVRRLGKLRAIAVHGRSTTAQVMLACDAMRVGDYLVPYRETPIPMVERVPLTELATPFPGRLQGTVLFTNELDANIAGAGHMVGIDLGHRAGLTAGDRILFWRPAGSPEQPRRILAQGIVLSTQGGGSTVKILESTTEVLIGDKAEVL